MIGLDARLPAPNAAFANAMLCHGLDFDDTHSDSVAHVSTVVVPAAAALAEARGASGRELLTAIVAGNEIVTRIGMAAPGAFHKRGFHPTAICGIFGATAAAARLGGLDAEQATSALGIAGSMASGLFAYLDDATATKPIHPAWAAHGALLAARLAAHGAEGPPGRARGALRRLPRLRRHADRPRAPARRPGLALGDAPDRLQGVSRPATSSTARSARPATLADELDPDEIEDVRRHHPRGGRLARARAGRLEDRAAHRLRGQVLAPVLDRGDARARPRRADDATRPRRCADARVLELARKVRYETKEYASYPAAFPGGVRITLRDGRTLEADFPHQLGAPENPMTRRAGAREVPRERRARRRVVRGARGGDPRARGAATTSRGSRSRAQPVRGVIAATEQREIVATVREWVEREVYPVASEYEHADEFPTPLVEDMKELGLFGVTIPEEYGGLGLDLLTYALHPGRALARLDVALGRPEHALHLGVDDQDARHRGAARALPAADGDAASCASPTR